MRAEVELAPDMLVLTSPDGRQRRLVLHGARFWTHDAACRQRFVRHLILEQPGERVDLITPPERGAIAPRAAGLPGVPATAVVVDGLAWETLANWLRCSGRLSGHTIAELARLACLATPELATRIGEQAAQIAAELAWAHHGPLRSGGEHDWLRPLERAARTSVRAARAMLAASLATRRLR